MIHFTIWFFSFLVLVIITDNSNALQCEQANSIYGQRLWNHVIYQSVVHDVMECVMRCRKLCYCQSINYRLADNQCQFNKASKSSHGKDYRPEQGIIYMEFENTKPFYKVRSTLQSNRLKHTT